MIDIIELPDLVLAAMAVLIIYTVMCRVRHFDSGTLWYVKAQHASIAIGAMVSVVVPTRWSAACVAAGAVLFLLFSTARWAHNPPEGISKGAT